MRLFFALPLDEPARDALDRTLAPLRASAGRGLRFVPVEQLHLTLAFLGDTAEAALPAIEAAGVEARFAPFPLGLHGAGAFPDARRPRVLWLGVRDGATELHALARRLRSALRARGIAFDDRPFRAHLSLARVRPRGEGEARRVLAQLPDRELARFVPGGFALVRSEASPGGARHSVVRSFPA